MKETFIQFLKNNNFYEGWMEGYKLDNEIFEDVVPLEEFFKKVEDRLWLYSGPQAMALLGGGIDLKIMRNYRKDSTSGEKNG